MDLCVNVCVCLRMFVYTCVCVCMRAFECVRFRVYVYVCCTVSVCEHVTMCVLSLPLKLVIYHMSDHVWSYIYQT